MIQPSQEKFLIAIAIVVSGLLTAQCVEQLKDGFLFAKVLKYVLSTKIRELAIVFYIDTDERNIKLLAGSVVP